MGHAMWIIGCAFSAVLALALGQCCARVVVGLVSGNAAQFNAAGGGIDVLRVRHGSLGGMLDNYALVVRGPLAMNSRGHWPHFYFLF